MNTIYRTEEEQVITNEAGGKQHQTGTRAHAIFPNALIELLKLRYQAKFEMGYDDDNYKLIERDEHIGRAINHIFSYLAGKGDPKEELTHAACRVLMALEERCCLMISAWWLLLIIPLSASFGAFFMGIIAGGSDR